MQKSSLIQTADIIISLRQIAPLVGAAITRAVSQRRKLANANPVIPSIIKHQLPLVVMLATILSNRPMNVGSPPRSINARYRVVRSPSADLIRKLKIYSANARGLTPIADQREGLTAVLALFNADLALLKSTRSNDDVDNARSIMSRAAESWRVLIKR